MIVKVIAYDYDTHDQKAGVAVLIDEHEVERDIAEWMVARKVSELFDKVFP